LLTYRKQIATEHPWMADVLTNRCEPWLVVDLKIRVGNPEFGAVQLLWRPPEDGAWLVADAGIKLACRS
jgi:hypothetical protein